MGKETKFLIPSKGMLIRDPATKDILSEKGEVKPWIGPAGRYWRRRVADGSCTIGEPQKDFSSFKKEVESNYDKSKGGNK